MHVKRFLQVWNGIYKMKMTHKLELFQVMLQPQNRHMSISLYIAVLAVADTIALLLGI